MNEEDKERIVAKLKTPAYPEALKELLAYLKCLREEQIWVERVFGEVIYTLTGDESKESLEEIGRLTVAMARQN